MRAESERIFLDFFRVPADDERRRREGVYASRTLGPPDARLQVILLDTRSFRSPRDPLPNNAADASVRASLLRAAQRVERAVDSTTYSRVAG